MSEDPKVPPPADPSQRKTHAEARKLRVESAILLLTFLASTISGTISFMVKREQDTQAQKLAELRETNTSTLSVHKEVVDALKSGNKRLENVAIALVLSLPGTSPEYRSHLLEAISKGSENPDIRQRAEFELDKQKQQQRAAVVSKGTGSPGWKVDVFHCAEDSAPSSRARDSAEHITARHIAENISQKALGQNGSVREVRVRPLPKSVNRLPQYDAAGLQVRFDEGEKDAAWVLAGLISNAASRPVAGVQSYGNSTAYLSVFVCPDGKSSHFDDWVRSPEMAAQANH